MAVRKILVLGGTGGTGGQVIRQALARGHIVTALVRDPGRVSVTSDRLHVRTGSVTEAGESLHAALAGQDAVISALGRGTSFTSGGLIARSMALVVPAMEAQGVRRVILTSAFGVGETIRDVPLLPRLFIRLKLQDLYRDKAAGEALLRQSALEWTIVYPSALTDGPSAGRIRAGERLALRGFPRTARTDAATFLLDQVDDASYVRKGVLISA